MTLDDAVRNEEATRKAMENAKDAFWKAESVWAAAWSDLVLERNKVK